LQHRPSCLVVRNENRCKPVIIECTWMKYYVTTLWSSLPKQLQDWYSTQMQREWLLFGDRLFPDAFSANATIFAACICMQILAILRHKANTRLWHDRNIEWFIARKKGGEKRQGLRLSCTNFVAQGILSLFPPTFKQDMTCIYSKDMHIFKWHAYIQICKQTDTSCCFFAHISSNFCWLL